MGPGMRKLCEINDLLIRCGGQFGGEFVGKTVFMHSISPQID